MSEAWDNAARIEALEPLTQVETEFLDDAETARNEKREATVRIVEYSCYPRIARGEHARVAFTRNQSASGMCLVTNRPETRGTLLRVAGRTVDGVADLDALAHVVWCEARRDGRYWIGLALIEPAARSAQKVPATQTFAARREAALAQSQRGHTSMAQSA
ncbi:MAG: PilZ domain-containing protein [Myxococcota bacterium]|nr:PilZ domain-containing protein [Myxococcota bacterium]